MSDTDGVASGYSLWLMPPVDARPALADVIASLSIRYHTPVFEPHITLVGDVPARPHLEVVTRALADRLTALPLELNPADWGATFFHSVFLPVVPNESLDAAHAMAHELFELHPRAAYEPHLSLLYGHLPPKTKSEIARALTALAPQRFVVEDLRLQETIGTAEQWKPVLTLTLGAGS